MLVHVGGHGDIGQDQQGARLPGKTKPPTSELGKSQEIREWARAIGFGVSDRGRVSQAVWDTFDAVH